MCREAPYTCHPKYKQPSQPSSSHSPMVYLLQPDPPSPTKVLCLYQGSLSVLSVLWVLYTSIMACVHSIIRNSFTAIKIPCSTYSSLTALDPWQSKIFLFSPQFYLFQNVIQLASYRRYYLETGFFLFKSFAHFKTRQCFLSFES